MFTKMLQMPSVLLKIYFVLDYLHGKVVFINFLCNLCLRCYHDFNFFILNTNLLFETLTYSQSSLQKCKVAVLEDPEKTLHNEVPQKHTRTT